ncbi:hypothetical protein F2Q69_00032897 [Brassica cretica]|uniref:Aldehyde dehydrogenase domain-containing protein n=1 Tax=Brassica cretica TaxID=69181 RepID=A0A8S9SEF9_BRACR|nr:hypothetical protein F2Q69_00032897 [Brassica cretica]
MYTCFLKRIISIGLEAEASNYIISSTCYATLSAVVKPQESAFDGKEAALLVDELRTNFNTGRTRSYEWRISQLQNIAKMIDEKEKCITEALHQDLSKPELEAFLAELSNTKSSCMLAIKELKNWMAPETVKTSVTTFPSSAQIVSEPLGVVLIISAWNFPFFIGAISAGNAVVLKPSEIAPATSSLLAKLFSEYLDETTIRVVQGGVPETTALLDQKWDKIFFTGGARVGRIVMAAAAKNLTPVVLELGGKCPALVDSDVNLQPQESAFDGKEAALLVDELRTNFNTGRTRSYEWRISQLQNIAKMIDEKEKCITEALHQDLSKPELEAFLAELSNTKSSCMLAIKELKNWMAPETVKTSVTTFPSSAQIVSEPLGVVLVISAWNFPFLLSVEPVIGAISAGNAVVLKPSEIAPATSSLLAKLFSEYLDETTIRVVQGGVPETTALLDQKWDKIFFTGGARVGRIVMAAAAKNLTPVVLELGGKCPALVDSDVNLQVKINFYF